MFKGKKLRKSKEKSKARESKNMSKKHIFLSIFSKITIFACVFCAFPAWSETTACDINYTPVTGNSIQNGTPTPKNPVEVISVGNKTINLFDKSTAVYGDILSSTGQITSTVKYRFVSDFIRINEGDTISFSGTFNAIDSATRYNCGWIKAFYDENKTFVAGSRAITYSPLVIPSGAKYIRLECWNDQLVTPEIVDLETLEVQVEQGSTATPYVPYGYQIPVVGTGANGSQTTTSVYLGEPLRKVGDYADVLDYKNGTITRNVGVKVLDGTENWVGHVTLAGWFSLSLSSTNIIATIPSTSYCSHFPFETSHSGPGTWFSMGRSSPPTKRILIRDETLFPEIGMVEQFKDWLAAQYAAGTPVTVYYPLATPVVEQIENWSCTPPITDIQIATTKMVDEEFAQAEANLAATVQTIESVVSRTIAQTGQIATLQAEKQTRPDETCPANMKCLLVQDEDGTPHWYPIIEP
ncbi:MAG: hypothetical protein KBT14_01550 [Proteobacteria bacterium]|nr:hypothetical protein [Candidatus Enterousia onthequi]